MSCLSVCQKVRQVLNKTMVNGPNFIFGILSSISIISLFSFSCFSQKLTEQEILELFPSISVAELLDMDPLDAYIYMDQNFNVRSRVKTNEDVRLNLLKSDEKETVDVYLYEVDKNSITSLESIFPNSAISYFKNGDKYVFPVLATEAHQIEGSAKFKKIHSLKAKKLLGRKSFMILPGQGYPPLTIKFIDYAPTILQKAYRGVLNSDYIQTYQHHLPPEFQNIILSEPLALQTQDLTPLTVVIRDASVIQEAHDHVRVLPAHGLLGCNQCMEHLAQKKGMSVFNWKSKVFIPKLAAMSAYYNVVLGVSTEAHTQNILLKINFDTGEIEKLELRDLSDVLLDPIPMMSKGDFQLDPRWDLLDFNSIHRNEFADFSVPEAKDMWYHVAIYTGQAIDSHVKGFQHRRNLTSIFLKVYIQEVERILGKRIDLSTGAKDVLQSLENAGSIDALKEGELQDRGRFRNALASVLKSVYENIEDVQYQKLVAVENVSAQSQENDIQILLRGISMGQIRYTSAEARARLTPLLEKFEKLLSPYVESVKNAVEIYKTAKEKTTDTTLKITRGFYKFFASSIGINSLEESFKQRAVSIDDQLKTREQNRFEKERQKETKGFRKDRFATAVKSFSQKYIGKLSFFANTEGLITSRSHNLVLVKDAKTNELIAVVPIPEINKDFGGKNEMRTNIKQNQMTAPTLCRSILGV